MGKKKGGKAPKGRAKQKQKAQQQSSPFASRSQHFIRGADPGFDDDDDSPKINFRGFAQGGSRDYSSTQPNVKLRHQAISFVSAGTNTPVNVEPEVAEAIAIEDVEDELDPDDEDDAEEGEQQDDDEDAEDDDLQTNIVQDMDAELSAHTRAMNIDGAADVSDVEIIVVEKPASPQPEVLQFVVDTMGDPSLQGPSKTTRKPLRARSLSPAPSDSSDEVILFHGRNRPKVVDDPILRPLPQSQPSAKQATKATPHVTDDLLAALQLPSDTPQSFALPARGWAAEPSKWEAQEKQDTTGFTAAPEGSWWRKQGSGIPSEVDTSARKVQEEETAKQTVATPLAQAEPKRDDDNAGTIIASLQAELKQSIKENKAAKAADLASGVDGTEELEVVAPRLGVKNSRRGKRGRKRANRLLRDLELDASDPEEAAYEDYMENLRAQLEAEGAGSDEPSLFVNGKAVLDTELLDAAENVQVLEVKPADDEVDEIDQDTSDEWEDEDELDDSDLDSSDLEEELEDEEREQWEDEEDLRQRRMDAKTDEQLARLWAKQAELGIDDDDLIIDDGMYASIDELEGFGDLDEARAGLEDLAKISLAHSKKRRGGGRRRGGDPTFPDASALADSVEQYGENGFDIMDFERPSLRPTKKGRKAQLPPELEAISDEDLKSSMREQWDNDRAKKRAKKVEREEQRAMGMLGGTARKTGKADLNVKYSQGMTMQQIHAELRLFLEDDDMQSRPFPPMEKNDRKTLHQVATALNLKSKSVGSGHARFPVLYKTARTVDYSEAAMNRAIRTSTRSFLKNDSWSGGGKSGGKKAFGGGGAKAARGGGAAMAAVGLRHGEIVGAGARELGSDNFGHRLMEKMGWTKGMALGKDGEGLLVPVEQKMKSGRGGLG